MKTADFVVVGGGIVGLAIAKTLLDRKTGSVVVLEKENDWACHASGRNSGILHAGFYYDKDSLKARVCVRGNQLMYEYAKTHSVPVKRNGKLVVASNAEEAGQLQTLVDRGRANGVRVEKISGGAIREIEPLANAEFGAVHSPDTGVIDPKRLMHSLAVDLGARGADLRLDSPVRSIDAAKKTIRTAKESFSYGHFFNAAGLFADRIAHRVGVGRRYRVLPFKGIYRKLRPEFESKFTGSIYPVPDLGVPFLGVQISKTATGEVTLGPTAVPAFGRENYGWVSGIDLEAPLIAGRVADLYLRNPGGFRKYVKEEIAKVFNGMVPHAQKLAPSLKPEDFIPCGKVGIRAQLYDTAKRSLVYDFLVEKGPASTHVLNAVSPAFTSSFAFAETVLDGLPH